MSALEPSKERKHPIESRRVAPKYHHLRPSDTANLSKSKAKIPEFNTFIGSKTEYNVEDFLRTQEVIAKFSGKPLDTQGRMSQIPTIKKVSTKEMHPNEQAKDQPFIANSVEYWIKKVQDESLKKDSEGAFVYLKAKSKDNPYDLSFCSYTETSGQYDRYYTLSRKGFTSYARNNAEEFLPIAEWIMERELFNQVKSLSVFKHFRTWKVTKIWRHNVIDERRKFVKNQLERRLIHLKPGMADLLIKHGLSCKNFENLKLFDTQDPEAPMSLAQYQIIQEEHLKLIRGKIEEASEATKRNFMGLIEKSMNDMKKKIRESSEQKDDDEEILAQELDRNPSGIAHVLSQQLDKQRKKTKVGALMQIDAVMERLGFQSNLSYEHRNEIKKQCRNFIRVSYLLDLMAKNSLISLYITSMKIFNEYFIQKTNISLPNELPLLKQAGEYVVDKGGKPIITLSVVLEESPIPEERIRSEAVDAFERPPLGAIDESNFDPTCHLETVNDVSEIKIGRKIRRLTVDGIGEFWLKLKPETGKIKNLLEIFANGMQHTLKRYERHSNTPALHPYACVLEEWEEPEEVINDLVLNCESILEGCPEYVNRVTTLEHHISKIEENIEQYLRLLNPYLLNYWKYSRIPWDIIRGDKLRYPVEVITLLAKQIMKYKEEIPQKIPTNADIGYCALSWEN